MASNRGGTWDGGYVRTDSAGRKTFIIRTSVGGRRYEISTRCNSSAAAEKQWKRFQEDPEGYTPSGVPDRPVILTVEMIHEFVSWSERPTKNGGAGNTPEWAQAQRRYLKWWGAKFRGKDLRRVTLHGDIQPALDNPPTKSRRHKIEVIKKLYSWLIARGEITPAQDPTNRTLLVPQAEPEQWTTPKAFSPEEAAKAREQVAPRWRACLDVLSGTGWHVTELVRFSRAGSVERNPAGGWILECPRGKGGERLRTAVSDEVAEAAKSIGQFTRDGFYKALKKAGVEITPGTFRHSIATWAIAAGTDPAAVSAFLAHKSKATTRRFYATLAVVPRIPTFK